MVWRNIKGKAGKLGYGRNMGFIYSNLVEDIEEGRIDYVKIPLDGGTFNMFGIDSSIVAILEIKPLESQLDNLYLKLVEDLADLNGDYNSANLYIGGESPNQIVPKYSEDGYEVEGYELKRMLDLNTAAEFVYENSHEIVYESELVERLKEDNPFMRLLATKYKTPSKKEGEIDQTFSLGMDSDLLEMRVIAKSFIDNGKNLLMNDGMDGYINELDLYVDSEAIMELRETPLNSGRRFLKRVTEPVTDYLYGF